MRSRILPFMATAAIFLSTACSSVRETRPLAYAGDDGGSTIGPIEAALKQRGYAPVCRAREFCKFDQSADVTIHFKAKKDKVVVAVDVAKSVPAGKRKELTESAMKLGEEIFAEASAKANANEKAEAAARKEEERREAAREEAERKAEAQRAASGEESGGILGALTTVAKVGADVNAAVQVNGPSTGGATGKQGGSGGTNLTCCVNKAFYDCPSAAAVNKCGGEFAMCVSKCGMGSDFSCADACMKDHPPDPSQCRRDSSRDGTCP